MNNLIIHYIATKSKVVEMFTGFCRQQDISLVEYENLDNLSGYLLLIEPVEVDKKLFALSSVWKPWLMEKKPEIRLVFAGFASSEHPSYLNLLELPSDLRAWLETAPQVGDYRMQYAGVEERKGRKYDVFIDPWRRRLPLTGRDMRKQLEKFTEGHDASKSFYQQIARLRKILVDIRFLLEEAGTLTEQDVKDLQELKVSAKLEWEYLNTRWEFYKPSFGALPFQEAFHEIDEKVKKLGQSIDVLQHEQQAPDVGLIDQLRDLVRFELKRYVHLEDHW